MRPAGSVISSSAHLLKAFYIMRVMAHPSWKQICVRAGYPQKAHSSIRLTLFGTTKFYMGQLEKHPLSIDCSLIPSWNVTFLSLVQCPNTPFLITVTLLGI